MHHFCCSLFKGLSDYAFPHGVVITSTHPTIPSRIERVLGAGNATRVGCNVLWLGIKNVRIERVELDNTGCVDEALSQLMSTKGLEDADVRQLALVSHSLHVH